MHGCGGVCAEPGQGGIPQGIAQARGECTRSDCVGDARGVGTGAVEQQEADCGGQWQGAQKIARGLPGRVVRPASAQGIDARQQQNDQAQQRKRHACALSRIDAFAPVQAVADHGGLYSPEQQEGPGPRGKADVGKRKAGGIAEQGECRGPVPVHAQTALPQHDQQVEHDGPGCQADASETGGIDAGAGQGRPAQQGVPGERDHRQKDKQGQAYCRHGIRCPKP